MDAFWGEAGLTSLRRQTNDLLFREEVARRQAGRPPLMPGMPGTGLYLREHALPDVFWLNYLGPALVERFGRDRFAGLGVRQAPTANGGLVVWATETPFVFDPGAERLNDYAWKRPSTKLSARTRSCRRTGTTRARAFASRRTRSIAASPGPAEGSPGAGAPLGQGRRRVAAPAALGQKSRG